MTECDCCNGCSEPYDNTVDKFYQDLFYLWNTYGFAYNVANSDFMDKVYGFVNKYISDLIESGKCTGPIPKYFIEFSPGKIDRGIGLRLLVVFNSSWDSFEEWYQKAKVVKDES